MLWPPLLRAEPPGKKQGSWYMMFWVHHGAGHGDKCHYCTPEGKWSLTRDKHLLCIMAFSVMVTIVGVTKIATGYPERTKGATGQKASSSRMVLS